MTIRYLEHTADAAFRVEAPSLGELFAEAARALVGLLVERPDAVEVRAWRELDLEAARLDDLLHDFLAEILLLFDGEGFLPGAVHVEVEEEPPRLRARLGGEAFDGERHGSHLDVKAVTYHGLLVERTESGYAAEVVVDVRTISGGCRGGAKR